MLDLGIIRPGRTVRIPFSSFDKDDGSSITMTNFAVADLLVYKDGNTTSRASTAGFTATTDFNSKTGKHLAIIDLADNTTAGFFTAGSEYLVALDSVTIDAITTGGWLARFRIGYPGAILDTTIATLSTQTSFTLTEGPAEADALNGCVVVIHDIASAVQWSKAVVLDYDVTTKTVTLVAGVTFTAAAGDNISVFVPSMQPSVWGATDVVQSGDSFARIGATGSGLTSLAQAAVVGALADAAADGDPTSADTLMQYVKQLVNTFAGSAGLPTYPAAAAPGNAVNLAEVLRYISDLVTALGAMLITSSVDDVTPAAGDFTGVTALSSTDDFYNFSVVAFTSGTLKGLARQVSDYVGGGRQFLFTGTGENADAPFPAAPTNGDTFVIIGRIGT